MAQGVAGGVHRHHLLPVGGGPAQKRAAVVQVLHQPEVLLADARVAREHEPRAVGRPVGVVAPVAAGQAAGLRGAGRLHVDVVQGQPLRVHLDHVQARAGLHEQVAQRRPLGE